MRVIGIVFVLFGLGCLSACTDTPKPDTFALGPLGANSCAISCSTGGRLASAGSVECKSGTAPICQCKDRSRPLASCEALQ
jgi:hypothetical protein